MSKDRNGAIVTGGAMGIGRGLVEGLLEDGFSVLIADRDADKGAATAAHFAKTHPGKVIFHQTDVSDRASVRAAVQACRQAFGAVKVMVNNAGFNKPEPFLEASEEIWDAIMKVNALGVLIGTQEAAKAMIEDGIKGKIINTASIAGRTGYADWAPYCASKAAVVSLTQAGARALAPHGITVNAFGPGVVATPLWDQLDKDLMAMGYSKEPGEAIAGFSAGILLGHIAEPKEVAGTVRFLASPASDYMTGQVLLIDGGMILQ
jgi:meso-butanediol dehydrogenase/(S,S)-butanediol dehydrogenase/diacetyl reductase